MALDDAIAAGNEGRRTKEESAMVRWGGEAGWSMEQGCAPSPWMHM